MTPDLLSKHHLHIPPDEVRSTRNLHFLRILSLKGPNIWTYRPVLEVWVDIGNLEDEPSNLIPGFAERLTRWLPSLIEHHCSPGHRGGFVSRLYEGTWAGHILEHVTLELQALAGMPAGFGRAREMDRRGVYKVVVRAFHEIVTLRALELARALILAAMDDREFDVPTAIDALRDLAETHLLGPSTHSIVEAADDHDIPALRMNEGNLVQLGYGSAQRRIWTAETDQTSAIAETISRDKALTKTLLQQAGIPIPQGHVVHSAQEAWEVAQDIGLPVVVKPLSGNHGRAVFTHLTQQTEIETAYTIAEQEDEDVLIERHIVGHEHRLLVVGNKLVAAARGEIAMVTGDGASTIGQLIDRQINSDPRRGDSELHPLNCVRVDSACLLELRQQGFQSDADIPTTGQEVVIQRMGNVAADVTAQVHPDTAVLVALAARIVGLDIAGIDLVAQDISQPLALQQGAIVEVNAGPGLLMHLKPAQGKARPVGQAIVEHLFPRSSDGRIPIIAVTGNTDRTAVAHLIAYLLQLDRKQVALASRDGLFLDQRQIDTGNQATFRGADRLLRNPAEGTAVMEIDDENLLEHGLAFDRCQLAVITDIDAEKDFSAYAMNDPAKRFMIYRTPIDVVLPGGAAVLPADQAVAHELAALCDGEVIFYTENHHLPTLGTHFSQGGRAVTLDQDAILFTHGDTTLPLMRVKELPHDLISVPQALAAMAAVLALGVSAELIRTGLMAYTKDKG
ncbi:MAG: cyanophycin synthetase [Betaproteobacteria bacterium]|nr:cyanophycin synthetase [Betaproteobacteria bacterium]